MTPISAKPDCGENNLTSTHNTFSYSSSSSVYTSSPATISSFTSAPLTTASLPSFTTIANSTQGIPAFTSSPSAFTSVSAFSSTPGSEIPSFGSISAVSSSGSFNHNQIHSENSNNRTPDSESNKESESVCSSSTPSAGDSSGSHQLMETSTAPAPREAAALHPQEPPKACMEESTTAGRLSLTPTNNNNNNTTANNNNTNSSQSLSSTTTISTNSTSSTSSPKGVSAFTGVGVKTEGGLGCFGYKAEEEAGLIRPAGITEVRGDTRFDLPSYTTLDLDRQASITTSQPSHMPPTPTTLTQSGANLLGHSPFDTLKAPPTEFPAPTTSTHETYFTSKTCEMKPLDVTPCTAACIPHPPHSMYQRLVLIFTVPKCLVIIHVSLLFTHHNFRTLSIYRCFIINQIMCFKQNCIIKSKRTKRLTSKL